LIASYKTTKFETTSDSMNRKTILLLLCLMVLTTASFAQQYYYVVIGTFRVHSNATKFTAYARSKFYDAEYKQNKKNQLYYVFALRTANREEAIQKTLDLQKNSEFKDTWTFVGLLGNDTAPPKEVVSTQPKEEPKADTTAIARPLPDDSIKTIAPPTAEVKPTEIKAKGKLFKFLVTTPEGEPLSAEVHAVNRQQAQDLAAYKSNEYVDVKPLNPNQPITLVCGLFGYKEVEKPMNYADPSTIEGAVQDSTGAWIIPFRLQKLDKGDVSVMYHVSFYKDAVIMLPNSKSELDALASFLQDHPDHTITVHGHCNGNHSRRIIALGDSKNYFNVNGSKEIKGSAKELGKQRAEAVQMYLADKGINKNRVKIYSWGGTNMIVDENSPSAKLNDRIEVEIMATKKN
jgi:outer membrane protein OmpA-like peptidoglycan-associated protein